MSQVQLKEQIIRNPGRAKMKACSMTVWLLSIFQSGKKKQCSKEEETESTDLGRVWNQGSSRINVCRVRTRWYLLFQKGNYLEMEASLERVTLRHVWKSVTWSGEVAQCFKALALAEDQSLLPESTWLLQTNCSPSSSGSGALFQPVWPLHTQSTHIFVQTSTRTHKIKAVLRIRSATFIFYSKFCLLQF